MDVLPGARVRDGEASDVLADDGVKTAALGVKASEEAVRPDEGVDGLDEAGVARLLFRFP